MGRRVRFSFSFSSMGVESVRELGGQCTCPEQIPVVKVGEGKYRIGDSKSLSVRMLRNHVMVRVGGGWDTLENYLDKHDPCRCFYKGQQGGPVTPTEAGSVSETTSGSRRMGRTRRTHTPRPRSSPLTEPSSVKPQQSSESRNGQRPGITTPSTFSSNSQRKLQRQKTCDADAEVLIITRNNKGQHSVQMKKTQRFPVSQEHGKRLQKSVSFEGERGRSNTSGPHDGLNDWKRAKSNIPAPHDGLNDGKRAKSNTPGPRDEANFQPRSILKRRDPEIPAEDPEMYKKLENLFEEYREKELDAEYEQLLGSLRENGADRPHPPKSVPLIDTHDLEVPPEDPEMYEKMTKLLEEYRETELNNNTKNKLLSRPEDEISAALPPPSTTAPLMDTEDLGIPSEDPATYESMEMLFEEYRQMELDTENKLLSSSLDEIRTDLPSPSKVEPLTEKHDLEVPPEDPEMYKKLEMLFEEYRGMEQRTSERNTAGGSPKDSTVRTTTTLSRNHSARSKGFPDNHVNDNLARSSKTPRPDQPLTIIGDIFNMDADTFVKNPSALMSKIRQALRVRPRKDKHRTRTRIPAPTSLSHRNHGLIREHSDFSNTPVINDIVPSDCDDSNDESIDSGLGRDTDFASDCEFY